MRALPRLRRLPLPGPRLRGAGRRQGAQVRGRAHRLGGVADPPLEPIVPAASLFHYRNKLEYSFTRGGGTALGFHRAGRWDEVLEVERAGSPPTSATRSATPSATGLARRGSRRTHQETQTGYLRHLVVREGRNTGQALVQLVTAPGELFETGYFVEVLRRFPEVRSIHWAVNDTPAEVTNLPTPLLWGEEAIEEELSGCASASGRTRSCRRTRRWPSALPAGDRVRGADRRRDRLRPLLRHRHDRARDGAQALTVWGVDVSEESVACALENVELNGITNAAFFAGNVAQSLEELAERAGRRTSSSSTRRAPGSPGRRCGGWRGSRPADRLRLLQPDDARRRRQALRVEWGYELVRARPVDMFPHTPHVETVALLGPVIALTRLAPPDRELDTVWRSARPGPRSAPLREPSDRRLGSATRDPPARYGGCGYAAAAASTVSRIGRSELGHDDPTSSSSRTQRKRPRSARISTGPACGRGTSTPDAPRRPRGLAREQARPRGSSPPARRPAATAGRELRPRTSAYGTADGRGGARDAGGARADEGAGGLVARRLLDPAGRSACRPRRRPPLAGAGAIRARSEARSGTPSSPSATGRSAALRPVDADRDHGATGSSRSGECRARVSKSRSDGKQRRAGTYPGTHQAVGEACTVSSRRRHAR